MNFFLNEMVISYFPPKKAQTTFSEIHSSPKQVFSPQRHGGHGEETFFIWRGGARQIKDVLSFQDPDPILYQNALKHLGFDSRRDEVYDPIPPQAGLDHKKSPSVPSVSPW
jgi:hypothetical protein